MRADVLPGQVQPVSNLWKNAEKEGNDETGEVDRNFIHRTILGFDCIV
jgi:hypothetical protein